jgi:hypothetical protein
MWGGGPQAGRDAALVQAVVSVRVSVPPRSRAPCCRYCRGRPGETQETDGPEHRTGDLKSGNAGQPSCRPLASSQSWSQLARGWSVQLVEARGRGDQAATSTMRPGLARRSSAALRGRRAAMQATSTTTSRRSRADGSAAATGRNARRRSASWDGRRDTRRARRPGSARASPSWWPLSGRRRRRRDPVRLDPRAMSALSRHARSRSRPRPERK